MNRGKVKNEKAITLIALVVTIIVLIILAGVTISLTLNQNGIINKAKEAKQMQLEAEYKEKIGADLLAAYIDATSRNEELEEAQVKDIVSNYGELQEDGDTIKIKDSDIQVSLKDIYNGTTISSSGSYTENKIKIAELEKQISDMKQSLAEAITKAGVETSSDSDIDTFVNNIDKVATTKYESGREESALKTVTTFNGDTTVNIKEMRADYASLTEDDFVLIVTGISGGATGIWMNRANGESWNVADKTVSTNPTKKYDAETGILTISGCSKSSTYNESGHWGVTPKITASGTLYCTK